MGLIIAFFQWVDRALRVAYTWCTELPAKIILFVTTFFTAVTGIIDFVSNHCLDVIPMMDNATSYVGQVNNNIQGHAYGSLLVHCLSLDIAFNYIVSVGGVFVGLVGVLFLSFFCYAVTCWIIPLSLQLTQKVISVLSAGFVKT